MPIEFWLFFAIGLGILLFEAHRQFNHPAYTKSEDDAAGNAKIDYIFSLSPSEIRNRSAYFSAELVYILAIVAIYVLLTTSEAVNNVLDFIINFRSDAAPPGGGLPEAATTAGNTPATDVPSTDQGRSAIDEASEPFVVSVMMVTALRFPLVRRIEVLLRSTAQRLFGIPWIPHRLRQKIEDTPMDLAAVEAEIESNDGVGRLQDRIRNFEQSAKAAGVNGRDVTDFSAHLSKLAAYQLWVNEVKIWPSADFRSGYHFFRELNDPLSDQINTLFKDCDLLSSSNDAMENGGDHTEKRRMRRELWELKATQSKDLARKMAAMMALYDQNSNWPEDNKPGAISLRAFLESVRAKDEAKVFQINVAILLLFISAIVSFVAGYTHAAWLQGIANNLGLIGPQPNQVPPSDPQFAKFVTARNFMLSSLLVYGLSMWAALDIRRRLQKRGHWRNAFERSRIPPMGQLVLVFGVLGLLVFSVYLTYQLALSPGWDPFGTRDNDWWQNVARQSSLSFLFAIIGGFHGLAVALMMDLGEKKAEARSWLFVAGGYIAAMMVLGYLLGNYYPTSFDEIRSMREMLYAVDLGLIALFTSVALTLFLGPASLGSARGTETVEGSVP